jgi:hypothetical protein
MIDTEFRFDKKDLVPKFKAHLKKYQDEDEKEFQPSHGKEVPYSKLVLLRKVQGVYHWALKESLLEIRQLYNHDDEKFKDVKNYILSYIGNKIKTKSDGTIYLRVPNLITFTGDKEQYDEWVVQNKRNQERLIRKIVEELNVHMDGNSEPDDNKPILNDDEWVDPDAPTEEELMVQRMQEAIENVVDDEFTEILFEYVDQPIIIETKEENPEIGKLRDKYVEKLQEIGVEQHAASHSFEKYRNSIEEIKSNLEKESEENIETGEEQTDDIGD